MVRDDSPRLRPRLRPGREATARPPSSTLLRRLQHRVGQRLDAGQRGWRGVYVLPSAASAQPVVVKVQLVRPGRTGHRSWTAAVRQHLDYVQREGVALGGEAGQLYTRDATGVPPAGFLRRSADDARQFRLIVSAARGADLDLTAFTRSLLRQVEADVGTRLDWVAVNHYDTAHPHTHVLVRGTDDQGQPLALQRHYLAQGLRYRAQAIATRARKTLRLPRCLRRGGMSVFGSGLNVRCQRQVEGVQWRHGPPTHTPRRLRYAVPLGVVTQVPP